MSEYRHWHAGDEDAESGEEDIDESGRNPTQQRLDDEGLEDLPVDGSWQEDDWARIDADEDDEGA